MRAVIKHRLQSSTEKIARACNKMGIGIPQEVANRHKQKIFFPFHTNNKITNKDRKERKDENGNRCGYGTRNTFM
jgi:hypothetical protein